MSEHSAGIQPTQPGTPGVVSARTAPVDATIPFVGRVWHAYRDLLGAMTDIHRQCGDVAWTRAGGLRVLVLFGPEAAGLAFTNPDDAFSNRQGWRLFLDHVFPGAILGLDGPEHRLQRRILQAAFTTPALRDYVRSMVPTMAIAMDQLGTRRRVHAYRAIKQLTLDVAASTFLGVGATAPTDKLNRAFVDAVEASVAVIRVNLWPTLYYRGLRGRRRIEAHLRALLPEKRAQHTSDLFGHLCTARSDEGESFSDDEIIHHMNFLMMAAHDTSTSTISNALYCLAREPQWQERLRRTSLSMPDNLDYDQLQQLDELGWVLQEVLRMHPPLPIMPRVVVKEVVHGGYRIESGTLVGIPVLHTHHDPTLWTEPHRFDPERFASGREEHRRHKYAWTPFGGGAHTCIGQRFGLLETKAALHLMLRRYRWSIPAGYRMPYQHVPIARPTDGLPLYLEPLPSA